MLGLYESGGEWVQMSECQVRVCFEKTRLALTRTWADAASKSARPADGKIVPSAHARLLVLLEKRRLVG